MSQINVATRSVDNLVRFYAIVIAFALTEALKKLLISSGGSGTVGATLDVQWQILPMFISFVMTIVPFFHGASYYLDTRYIFGPEIRRLPLLIDFLLFIFQGIAFIAMALVLNDMGAFFVFYVGVLGLDVIWTIYLLFSSEEAFKLALPWLVINLATGIFLWIVMIVAQGRSETPWVFCGLACLRTFVDYAWQLSRGVYMPTGQLTTFHASPEKPTQS